MAVKKAACEAGTGPTVREYRRGETVFSPGDRCDDVFYIQTGGVKLSMWSKRGREAVVGTLGAGDFFGEACLAGQVIRSSSATAITPTVIRLVGKSRMVQLLKKQKAMSRQFTANILSRTMRVEEDLMNHIFLHPQKRGVS